MLHALLTMAQGPQPVECTNCGGGDSTALIGILLAGGAFAVSVYTLYVTALRRPTIEVRYVPRNDELGVASWSGAMPTQVELHFWIAVTNTGASGTVVENLSLLALVKCIGQGRCLFRPPSPAGSAMHAGGRGRVEFPTVFERGDAETYRVSTVVPLDPEVETPEEFAARLRQLEAVEVTLEWSYPTRRRWLLGDSIERRQLSIQVSADRMRHYAIAHWRGFDDYREIAAMAEPPGLRTR